MDEDVFGKKKFKTYSRSKNKKGNEKEDAVFCEKAMENLKENLSISNSDDKKPKSTDGRRKRGTNKGLTSSPEIQKIPNKGRTRKSVLQVKIQKKASVTSPMASPPLYDSFKDDILFGEGLQPVKKTRHSKSKKPEASFTSKQTGKLKKNSVSQTMSEEKSTPSLMYNISGNIFEEGNRNSDVNSSTLKNVVVGPINVESLPESRQVRAKDKVNDWLAKSEECNMPEQDTSKEVFRGAQSITDDEMRSKLFPMEFFENLNCVLERRPSAQDNSYVKARQSEFLSQLALKTGSKQPNYLPSASATDKAQRVSDIDDDELMIMCASTQSGIQTETGTYTTTGMGTSKYMETQSDVQTETGTLVTTNTASSKFTETKTGTEMTTGSLMTTGMGTSKVTSASSFTAEPSTGRFIGIAKGVFSGSSPNSSKRRSSEGDETFKFKDPRVQKYLCSTMRRSKSFTNVDFPSELSAVTDSLRNQQTEEKTPRKFKGEDFKVPGSPTKCAVYKGFKKGTLQPKNSTKLFTTGFVEIIDTIPQMSTIVCDKSQLTVIENDCKQLICEAKQKRYNIKTSTPNKVDTQGQAFDFEIDVSSVNLDSEDDDLLHFNESKEVNSDECIQLSTTMIEDQQDENGIHNTLKEITSTKTPVSPITVSQADKAPNKMEFTPLGNMIKKESSKNNRSLKKQPKIDNVKTKVNNKGHLKSQKMLKSRVMEKSARCRTYSHLGNLSSQSGFKRRSSRFSTKSDMAKASVCDADKRKVSNGKKSMNVTSSRKIKLSTTGKDVYDITDSVTDQTNTMNVESESSLENDVFDIEESAINVPGIETQKLARKEYCHVKKPERKKAPVVVKKNNKRTSSEIVFSPKGLLLFNSSMASRSLDCLFYRHKHGNTSKYAHTEVTKALERDNLPVCSLMNEDFTCPRNKIVFTRFRSSDTSCSADIPIDDLLF